MSLPRPQKRAQIRRAPNDHANLTDWFIIHLDRVNLHRTSPDLSGSVRLFPRTRAAGKAKRDDTRSFFFLRARQRVRHEFQHHHGHRSSCPSATTAPATEGVCHCLYKHGHHGCVGMCIQICQSVCVCHPVAQQLSTTVAEQQSILFIKKLLAVGGQ